MQREHLVPRENVVALAVRQQVGVFHRAESDGTGDFLALGLRQLRAFPGNNFVGALLGFIEQVAELHGVAGARLERLAVVAHDLAEADVNQLCLRRIRFPAAKDEEKFFEMPGLPVVHDVNDFLRRPGFEPVIHGGEIGGGVIKTAVALAHERGIGHPFAVAVDEKRVFLRWQRAVAEHAHRAFAFAGDAAREQIGNDLAKPRIVKTFAEREIKLHAEPRINRVELDLREADHLLPDGNVFGVAGLELHQFRLGFFEPQRVRVAFGVDDFVKAFQFGDGVAFEFGAVQNLFPAEQKLAELRAPVADVVVADDAVAEQAQRALQRVADAGGADVADVHRLGDVGRAEINDHDFRRDRFGEKQMFAARGGCERLLEQHRLEPEVQEAGAGDFNFFANTGNIQLRQRVGGELARVQPARLGERHERIALVVAEFRVARADEHGGNVRIRQNFADGGLQLRFDLLVWQHEEILAADEHG